MVTIKIANPQVVLQKTDDSWTNVHSAGRTDEDTPARKVAWDSVCTIPCATRVDPTKIYRVGGRGVVPSEAFQVPSNGQPLVVAGVAASKGAKIGGTVVGTIGVVVFLLNGLAWIAASSNPTDSSDSAKSTATVGMIISAAAAVLGFTIAGASHTDVTLTPDRR